MMNREEERERERLEKRKCSFD